MSENTEQFYHYLVCGQVVFTIEDKEGINAIFVNAVIHGKEENLPVRVIARAQQAVQVQFYERMQNPKIKVLDVVITNLIPLGLMTKEEFQKMPEGMEKQEVSNDDPIQVTINKDIDVDSPYH